MLSIPLKYNSKLNMDIQVVMVLMSWAIDVPQELLQSDAKTGPLDYFIFTDPFHME